MKAARIQWDRCPIRLGISRFFWSIEPHLNNGSYYGDVSKDKTKQKPNESKLWPATPNIETYYRIDERCTTLVGLLHASIDMHVIGIAERRSHNYDTHVCCTLKVGVYFTYFELCFRVLVAVAGLLLLFSSCRTACDSPISYNYNDMIAAKHIVYTIPNQQQLYSIAIMPLLFGDHFEKHSPSTVYLIVLLLVGFVVWALPRNRLCTSVDGSFVSLSVLLIVGFFSFAVGFIRICIIDV